MTDRRSWTSGWSLAAPPPGRVIHRLYEEMRTPDTAFVVATGYGRALLPEADKVHHGDHLPRGRGRFSLSRLRHGHRHRRAGQQGDPAGSSGGQVKDFLMNDKCAAGTGRFLEMTMSRVGSDITSIDTFVEGRSR